MQETTNRSPQAVHPYALDRGLGYWELTFEGQHATFKNEAGAQYARISCCIRRRSRFTP